LKTGFIVHKVDGTDHVFLPSKMGLFFSTDNIKNKYTVKEYYDSHKAQSIHGDIGRPSTKEYI